MQRTLVKSVVTIGLLGGIAFAVGPYVAASLESTPANAAETSQGGEADGDANKPGDDTKTDPARVLVSVVQPIRRDLVDETTVAGNLEAEHEIVVRAEASGRVIDLRVEEGDDVARGATLVRLDPKQARVASRRAAVRAEGAQQDIDRAAKLAQYGAIGQEELEKLQRDRAVAKQDLAETRVTLRQLVVQAPFAGRITERLVPPGKYVQPGEDLFRLADFDPLLARVHVPFRDVAHLRVGQPVTLSLRDHEGVAFTGAIRQISPVVDPDTGTVKITIAAAEYPKLARPGAFVQVTIERARHEDVLTIPREAVGADLRAPKVFVVEDGIAHERVVEIGSRSGDHVEVTSGLGEEDQIVIAGRARIDDGTAVEIDGSDDPQSPPVTSSKPDTKSE